MKKAFISLAFATAALAFCLPGSASAQATRTWVSGVGDDANPCSRTAPCKTWAGAISKTAPGGEIDALDPGGFGALTITKSITLDGGGGQVASTLATGFNGIVFAGGASDIAIIRNVRFQGVAGAGNANAGTNAIRMTSGAVLVVENCFIDGFNAAGVDVATGANATVNIHNTYITNVQRGVFLEPTGGTVVGEMDHSTIQKVVQVGGTGGNGIDTNAGSAIFNVTNSNILNAASVGVRTGGAGSVISVDSSAISNNNTGVQTNGGTIRVSRNTLYDNNANFSINGGTIATDNQNLVAVNGATVPNGTITKQ